MKVLRVEIEDYGPFHGKHVFILADRGLLLVLGDNQDEPRMDSNGAGKSALFEAMDWCLFGKIPKGDHVDSIINDSGDGSCNVRVYLDDDGEDLSIHRGRNPKFAKLYVNGTAEDLTALDDAETQRHINRKLGLDRDIFHAAVFFGQNDLFRFADATNAKGWEILTKILHLEPIDQWLETTKQAEKKTEAKLNDLDGAMSIAKTRIETHKANIPETERNASEWENTRAQSLREATRQLNDFNVNIDKARAVVAQETQVKANEQVALTQVRDVVVDFSMFDAEIVRCLNSEREMRDGVSRANHEINSLSGRLSKLNLQGIGDCTECGQPITAEHLQAETAKLTEQLTQVQAALIPTKAEVDKWAKAAKGWNAKKEEQRRLHHEADKGNQQLMMELRQQLKAVQESKDYLAKAESHVDYLRKTMADTQSKPNPYREQLAQAQVEIDAEEKRLAVMTKETGELEEQFQYVKFWKTAFGPKGLKSYILDNRLQEMTDAANEWVRIITGGTFWIRFETQTMGRSSKKLTNEINIRVFRYNKNGSITDRNYRSWSGGQKERISLAIDFGLSRLVAKRAKKSYDLLILDELFKHLDRSGREAVVDMLRYLQREKNSLIVIDHNAEFQGAFENRVVVRINNRQSTIVEVDRAQPQAAPSNVGVPVRSPVPPKGQIAAF